MAALNVEFVVEQPGGVEVVATAHLDTGSGVVSKIAGLPDGLGPTSAWIAVPGGSEMFFRVERMPGAGDQPRYQVEDASSLAGYQSQFDWLAEVGRTDVRSH